MGKIIVEQVVSADGFAATKDGDLSWFENDPTFQELDRDQVAWVTEHVEAMILGRNTYEMFREFWPTDQAAGEPIADFINTKPKHVFSKSIETAPWGKYEPATVEGGDLAKTVAALRERYRGDLIVWGSLQLAEAMLRAKLVDELRLRSVPVLLGEGRPVAPKGTTKLTLLESKAYPKGHIVTSYRVAD